MQRIKSLLFLRISLLYLSDVNAIGNSDIIEGYAVEHDDGRITYHEPFSSGNHTLDSSLTKGMTTKGMTAVQRPEDNIPDQWKTVDPPASFTEPYDFSNERDDAKESYFDFIGANDEPELEEDRIDTKQGTVLVNIKQEINNEIQQDTATAASVINDIAGEDDVQPPAAEIFKSPDARGVSGPGIDESDRNNYAQKSWLTFPVGGSPVPQGEETGEASVKMSQYAKPPEEYIGLSDGQVGAVAGKKESEKADKERGSEERGSEPKPKREKRKKNDKGRGRRSLLRGTEKLRLRVDSTASASFGKSVDG